MKKKRFVLPEYVTAEDIKNVRKKLGLTQKNFAELIGCSKSTVERWESG
ncbi:MAG: helix-turn-helix domain-containing protein, partial [Lachnoclostridium sp.]|nr:helix-turn-helix domain-containing protein [Lachnoclostridium sp.]